LRALTSAQVGAPGDPEIHYYLGGAYIALGNDAKARKEIRGNRCAAALACGCQRLAGRSPWCALRTMPPRSRSSRQFSWERPDLVRAGAIEISLLRPPWSKRECSEGDGSENSSPISQALDPTDDSLRYEQVKLGKGRPPALARIWGADPERVLNVAIGYLDLGMYEDALDLLSRKYPPPIDVLATRARRRFCRNSMRWSATIGPIA